MGKREGVTLIELILVTVIIGIMATLAVPSYYRFMERNRERRGEVTLLAIHGAEKRYKLDNNAYYTCAPNCTLSGINSALGLELESNYFTYSIEPLNEGFRAIASRIGGDCTMSVTEKQSVSVRSQCLLD